MTQQKDNLARALSVELDQPFYDLIKLIEVRPSMSIADLGCGTGALTQRLHKALKAGKTVGVDNSAVMLKVCEDFTAPNLSYQCADIRDFNSAEKFDLIFSNSTLQWIPDHKTLFAKLVPLLAEGGQLAIQMPANFDSQTHKMVAEQGRESAFKRLAGDRPLPSILDLEEYSTLLYQLGFKKQTVRLQIYPHLFESKDSVVEWIKKSLVPNDPSLTAVTQEPLKTPDNSVPYFVPFKRLFIWASL